MYYELGEFFGHMLRRHRLWKDGEFCTAAVVGLLATGLFFKYPNTIQSVRDRFGDLLTVTSIIFGFVLTTLVFYIQAARGWSKNPQVTRIAEKLVDWHVWTIFCLLALMSGLIIVWICKGHFTKPIWWAAISHGLLVFLAAYCGFQIINHTLTVRWVFRKRHVLHNGTRNEHGEKGG